MQCVQAQFRNKLCRKPFLAIAKGAKSANTQWNISKLKKNLFQCKHVFALMSSKGYTIKTM